MFREEGFSFLVRHLPRIERQKKIRINPIPSFTFSSVCLKSRMFYMKRDNLFPLTKVKENAHHTYYLCASPSPLVMVLFCESSLERLKKEIRTKAKEQKLEVITSGDD